MSRNGDAKLNITAKDKTGAAFKSVQSGLRDVASSAAIVDGPLSAISGRVNAAGAAFGRMNPLVVVGGAAFGALGFILASGVKESIEYERQMLRLESQLYATNSAAGFTAQELAGMARELDANTLADDKETMAAITAMTAYKKVIGDTFGDAIRLSQDYAEVFGKSLDRSSIKIGRALDSFEGLSTINRELNLFSASELELAKEAFEAGNILEYQTEIIQRLEDKIGGSGAGAAGGAAGAIDSLSLAWRILKRDMADNSGMLAGVEWAAKLASNMISLDSFTNPLSQSYKGLSDVQVELSNTSLKLGQEISTLAWRQENSTSRTNRQISADFDSIDALRLKISQLERVIEVEELAAGAADERRKALQSEMQAQARRDAATAKFINLETKANNQYKANLTEKETLDEKFKADFDGMLDFISAANLAKEDVEMKHFETMIRINEKYISDKEKLGGGFVGPIKPDKISNKGAADMASLEAQLGGETAVKEARLTEWFARKNEIVAANVADDEKAERLRLGIAQRYAAEHIKLAENVAAKKLNMQMLAGTQIAGALSDLSVTYGRSTKSDFERNKVYSRGVAVMNTAAGVTKAWEQGGALGWIGAGAVLAAGLKQLSVINGTTYGGGGGLSSGGSGGGGSTLSGLPELPQSLIQRSDENREITIKLDLIADGEIAARIIKIGTPIARGRDFVVADIGENEFNTARIV